MLPYRQIFVNRYRVVIVVKFSPHLRWRQSPSIMSTHFLLLYQQPSSLEEYEDLRVNIIFILSCGSRGAEPNALIFSLLCPEDDYFDLNYERIVISPITVA